MIGWIGHVKYIGERGSSPAVLPINTAPPVITGALLIGSTLTATLGVWSGADSVTGEWFVDGVATGNTSTTYVIQLADAGLLIEYRETATNADGSVQAVASVTAANPQYAYELLATWDQPVDSTVYLWRHFNEDITHYEVIAPSDNSGHYTCAGFRAFGSSVMTFGRLREGVVGTTIHHSDSTVTKTGSWGVTTSTGSYGGTVARSDIAGATIACQVTGSILGLRLSRIVNGGYSTVAIDGDFTAATALPEVTQELIDAGKFDQSQIGHRYISSWSTGGASEPDTMDSHVMLVEGLSNGPHTILVRVAGTAQSGTGNRAYISGFVGCTGMQKPGDAGTAMLFTRDTYNAVTGGVSSQTLAWTFTPGESGGTGEWIGDNHGNETLDSTDWLVDGISVTPPALDSYISGAEIQLQRVLTMHHSVAGDVGEKVDSFTMRADRAYQLHYDFSVEWLQGPARLGTAYAGQLTHYNQPSNMPHGADAYRSAVIGGVAFIEDFLSDNTYWGQAEASVMAFLDADHPVIASVSVPDPETTLSNWQHAAPLRAFVADGLANAKAYFTRASGAGANGFEPIANGQIMQGMCSWRTFRLPNGYTQLKNAIEGQT